MGARLWLRGAGIVKVIGTVQAILKNQCILWMKSSSICATLQYSFCYSFTLNPSMKHMIFHLILQDCLFGSDCHSFLSSKDVRRLCILSNFVVNNSNIYFPISLAASQIECRTFSPSQYIMSWICEAVLGTIWAVSTALNMTWCWWVRVVKSLVAAHWRHGDQTVLCTGFLCCCLSLV